MIYDIHQTERQLFVDEANKAIAQVYQLSGLQDYLVSPAI